MKYVTNQIHLYFKGDRKLSICQNWYNGQMKEQEVLDITSGFDKTPVYYGNTVEDLIRVLQKFLEEDDKCTTSKQS